MSLEDKQAEYLQETTEEVIQRLSKLSTMEYELQRIKAAKQLNVRVGALDKMVTEERANETAVFMAIEKYIMIYGNQVSRVVKVVLNG